MKLCHLYLHVTLEFVSYRTRGLGMRLVCSLRIVE
jgi:hypothetical protein